MAVDSESRQLISGAIRSYLNGEIDNFRLDDILCECRTSDGLVGAITDSLWYLYDDCTRSHFRDDAAATVSRLLKRWEQLLLTSIDFDAPEHTDALLTRPPRSGIWGKVNDIIYGRRPGFASNPFWPLTSAAEWERLGIACELETRENRHPS